MFKNLKIATKLGFGFGLLLLLLLGLSLSALNTMAKMSEEAQFIVRDRYVKTKLANETALRTVDNGRLMRNMVLLADPEKIEAAKKTVDANREESKKALADLDKMINTPKGRELMDAALKQRSELQDKYTVFYGLVADKTKHQQAVDYLIGVFAPKIGRAHV